MSKMKVSIIIMLIRFIVLITALALAILTKGYGQLGGVSIGIIGISIISILINVVKAKEQFQMIINIVNIIMGIIYIVLGIIGIVFTNNLSKIFENNEKLNIETFKSFRFTRSVQLSPSDLTMRPKAYKILKKQNDEKSDNNTIQEEFSDKIKTIIPVGYATSALSLVCGIGMVGNGLRNVVGIRM